LPNVQIIAADRVEVLILVDNLVDSLSSAPAFVENEWSRLWRRGYPGISGRCLCCGAHGLSCAVTTWTGGQSHTVLFDTGPDEAVFERNVDRLGFDLGCVDAVVLSHGHWDHAGAMLRAVEMIQLRNGGQAVKTFMHPGMYRSRALRGPDGSLHRFMDVPTAGQLQRHGAEVMHSTSPRSLIDRSFFLSGEIHRVTPFETGMPGHVRRSEDCTDWEPDPLIMDERYLAVLAKDKGLIVVTACSHAGVINVLEDAQRSLPGSRLHAVLGGFHLSGANEQVIPQTIEALRKFDLQVIVPAHCTGWRAVAALSEAFGDAVAPAAVGSRFSF
jgi:7,8-dihydropterin-6-yl-methyl-4-(beta-D-ribofuranosyl)aminobenzene 5'-phosphate synthase